MGGPWEDYQKLQEEDGPWNDYAVAQVPSAPIPKRKSLLQDIASDYGDAILQGPAAMLARVPDTASKLSGRAGEFIAEESARRGMNPYVAAGIGTAAAMTPDIMMAAATPTGPILNTPEAAVSTARRALGFQKRFLKTPIAEKTANEAARVALERDIIPFSGNPKVMLERAAELESRAGSAIGDFLESQGQKFDPKRLTTELEALKATMVPPESVNVKGQSYYKDIQRQINKAINTIQSHGDQPIPFKKANEIKTIFQNAVNYNSDANTQILGRRIAGTTRETIDTALGDIAANEGTQGQFQKFLSDKKNYGAAARMQEAIQNKIAGEEGNMMFSLPSTVLAAGELATGNPLKAATTLGLVEAIKRRGAAPLARGMRDVARSRFQSGLAVTSLGLKKLIKQALNNNSGDN